MPMLDDVAAYLEAQSVGTVKTESNNPAAWPIYMGGAVPGSLDEVLYLAETAGAPPIDEMGSTVGAVVAEVPGLLVQARAKEYPVARARARLAWSKLHKLGNTTLGATRYLLILARQAPAPTGRDDAMRWVVGCNFEVTKEIG